MLPINVWATYVGQTAIITNLKMYIESAGILKKPLDHVLIYGNSGMGKTTLARLIATTMRIKIHVLNGPSLQKPSDIISVLTNLKDGEIIFIDEVHAVSKEVLEILYPALEDGKINIIIGKEYNSKNIQIALPPFTLIAATTELDRLATPFFNRFPIYFALTSYTNEEIGGIIHQFAQQINLPLDQEIANYIAGYARRTPRVAINLTKRLNDFYLTNKIKKLNQEENIKTALNQIGIYQAGLTKNDLAYLDILGKHQTIGLENLSQLLNIPLRIITTMIEPYLISEGYVLRTAKGRMITSKGETWIKKGAYNLVVGNL